MAQPETDYVIKYALPSCDMCHGAGIVYPVYEGGIVDYSRTVRCPSDGCAAENFAKYIRSRPQSLHDFIEKPQNSKALATIRQLVSMDGLMMALIYGGVGNGKTHLCHALQKALSVREVKCTLKTATRMLIDIKAGIGKNNVAELISDFETVPALIIDDYKSEYSTQWELSIIEEIINDRYQKAVEGRKCLTLLTTNNDIKEIPARIRSRFNDVRISKIIFNEDSDNRRENLANTNRG